jgi:hypothetical protein
MTVFPFSGSRCAFADGNLEFWQTTTVSLDINQDWTAAVEEHLKLGQDPGHLYFHYTDLGFVYKSAASWIDLGFNYKQIFKKDDDGHWSWENRPHLNVTFKGRLGTLDFADRSRFEFRDREDEEDLWRYVHGLKVRLPFEFTKYKFRPYVADQVYLNLEGQTFDKNRIYSGVTFELTKNLESEFYYVWQSAKSDGRWEDLNALGLLLRIRF